MTPRPLRLLLSLAATGAFFASCCVPAPAATQARTTDPPRVRIDGQVETKSDADPLARALAVTTALVAVLTLPIVAFQLRSTRKAARDERTAKFAERYSAKDFQDVVSPVLSFLKVEDVRECIIKLEAYERRRHASEQVLPRDRARPDGPKASVNDIFQVLYFLEELGAAYNGGELTRRKIHVTFPEPPVQLFTVGWWYICWRRGGAWIGPKPWRFVPERLRRPRPTDIYAQLEWMALALRDRVHSISDWDSPRTRGWCCAYLRQTDAACRRNGAAPRPTPWP